MAKQNKNIVSIKVVLVIGMLCLLGIAYPQDKTFVIEKGTKTFMLSSTGDQFKWFVNGVQVSETSGVYTATWLSGDYLLSILPFKGGCAGDTFYVALKVRDNITSEGGHVMFTDGTAEICPPSDAVPSSQEIFVRVKFYNDTLQAGETYQFSYVIDDNAPITIEPTNEPEVVLHMSTLDWTPGEHRIKITRLVYGQNAEHVVDYTTSLFIPTFVVVVKNVPSIGEIEY
ncbi:MAG: hypothetical protein ACP5PZ_11235 [Bacteroidales bacterium]